MQRRHFIAGLAGAAVAAPAAAQLGGLGGMVAGKLAKKAGNPLAGKAPITTSLSDARWADAARDGFTPREALRALTGLPRTANGGFTLAPGYFEMTCQSYCLHAGTHGPGGGEAYLYAPPLGSAEEAVRTIVQGSVRHPDIAQSDIQTLLWAIVSRAKFEDLSAQHKVIAARLLSKKQLAALNRSALDLIRGNPVTDLVGMPAPLRAVAEAESRLRGAFSAGSSFGELERIAVLAGKAPIGPGSIQAPSGRWSAHPDGYLIRYLPSGYSTTRVQLYVAPGSAGVGREYDPASHIAVPTNTARQRLIQSGRTKTA
jgi:hypothetical protein